jgi:hypothetical protein
MEEVPYNMVFIESYEIRSISAYYSLPMNVIKSRNEGQTGERINGDTGVDNIQMKELFLPNGYAENVLTLKSPRYPFDRRLGGPQSRFGRCG